MRMRAIGRLWSPLCVAAGIAALACAGVADAQEGIDLSQPLQVEDCVAIALGENHLIGEAEARVTQSQGSAKMALRAVLPSVTGRAGWSEQARSEELPLVVEGQLVGTTDRIYSGNLYLSANQSLIDLEGFYDLRSSRAVLSASHLDLDATREDVEFDVRGSFYGCVAALKLAEVEENAVEVAREQLRRAETLFNLGSVARSDVLQAKVNLADAEMNAINRRNVVRVEHSRLAMRMGLDPRIDLVVDTTLSIPSVDPVGSVEDWIQSAWETRSDLEAARERLHAAELGESSAKLGRLPTVGASLSLSHSGNSLTERMLDDVDWSRTWTIGLGVNFTVFDGFLREGRIESAVGQKRAQREALDRQVKEAALEVKDAFLSIRKERESLNAAGQTVRLAEENLRLQQALYESGAGTLLEWDNARLDLRRARVSLIQAQINLIVSHLRFQKSIGS